MVIYEAVPVLYKSSNFSRTLQFLRRLISSGSTRRKTVDENQVGDASWKENEKKWVLELLSHLTRRTTRRFIIILFFSKKAEASFSKMS